MTMILLGGDCAEAHHDVNEMDDAGNRLGYPTDETVIHSDQDTQFPSWAFTQRAKEFGFLPSMGSIGDCFDDTMVEAFWARMQVELLNRKR